jgi:hypothetical protein
LVVALLDDEHPANPTATTNDTTRAAPRMTWRLTGTAVFT